MYSLIILSKDWRWLTTPSQGFNRETRLNNKTMTKCAPVMIWRSLAEFSMSLFCSASWLPRITMVLANQIICCWMQESSRVWPRKYKRFLRAVVSRVSTRWLFWIFCTSRRWISLQLVPRQRRCWKPLLLGSPRSKNWLRKPKQKIQRRSAKRFSSTTRWHNRRSNRR